MRNQFDGILNRLDLPRDTGQYILDGAYTFRLSCRKILSDKKDKPYNNYGGNRQNIEKSMRSIYEADTGYKLFQCDQGGADALIVASLCRPGKYRALFANGIKPHLYNGLILFPHVWKQHFTDKEIDEAINCPIEELKNLKYWGTLAKLIAESDNWESAKRYYYIAKKVTHSSNYGMKGNTLRINIVTETAGGIVLTLQEAERLITNFHQTFPEIKDWHLRVYEEASKTRILRNIFGFPYYITDPVRHDDMKDLLAWIPQSSVACINRNAFILMQEYIESHNKNWHMLADTHDSIMGEAPDNEVTEAGEYARELLKYKWESPYDKTPFRMKASLAIGSNWGPYHETKNPLELKED